MPKRLFDWRKRHRGHKVAQSEAAPLQNAAVRTGLTKNLPMEIALESVVSFFNIQRVLHEHVVRAYQPED